MQNEPLGRRLGKGEKMEKGKAAALHTGGVRCPSYLDADARPLGAAAATAQSLATLNHLKLKAKLKLKPPKVCVSGPNENSQSV